MIVVTGSQIEHKISCPKGGLVLVRNDNAAKEWGDLVSQTLAPSDNTYKPKLNSRTVQGEKTRTGARQESATVKGGADAAGEAEGNIGLTVNRAARLVGIPVQVKVPA